MNERYIRRRYFNPKSPGSFSGLEGFFQNSVYKNKEEVKNVLENLYTFNVHKDIKKRFKRMPYFTVFIDHIWTSDVIYYTQYKHQNRQHAYILLVSDTFSKYLWCVPLKNKKSETVRDALKHIMKTSKRRPQMLHTDRGTEYFGAPTKSFLKQNGIRLYATNSHLKAMLAERLVKTIKLKIERIFTHTGKKNWINYLDDIVHSYNNSIHSAINMKPVDVNASNESQVWTNLYKKYIGKEKPTPKYNIGDHVKIAKFKLPLEKGYTANYSEETYTIYEVYEYSPVVVYLLKDQDGNIVNGKFHEQELVKVNSFENSDE